MARRKLGGFDPAVLGDGMQVETMVDVAHVHFKDSPVVRCPELNETVFNDYVEMLEQSGDEKWPFNEPIRLMWTGEKLLLYDGRHRFSAAVKLGHQFVPAIIETGSDEAALTLALGANRAHGLRRSNADKRQSVIVALAQWPDKSHRAIAKLCGVTHTTVANIAREIEPSDEVEGGKFCHPDPKGGGESEPAPKEREPHWREVGVDKLEPVKRLSLAKNEWSGVKQGLSLFSRSISNYRDLVPAPRLWNEIERRMREVADLVADWEKIPMQK